MKLELLTVGIFLAAGALACSSALAGSDRPVVLELFTSEGCSSCPAADRLLADIAKTSPVQGVTIIPLSMHVDYWDNLGWRDRFASRAFTDRQRGYQRAMGNTNVYTPQMVIDGGLECVGSDRAAVRDAIEASSRPAKLGVGLRVLPNADASAPSVDLRIDLGDRAALPSGDEHQLVLVVTEDGLSSDVRRGENAGRKLEHAAVVRQLTVIGDLPAAATLDTKVAIDPAWRRDRLHVSVLVQSKRSLHIAGAATSVLSPDR